MRLRWLVVAGLVIAAAGCAGAPRQPYGPVSGLEREEARDLKDRAEAKNDSITPYKAIGRIEIQGERGVLDGRAAWIAAPDGRLRVEALAVTGQPFARMICPAEQCFFIFRDGNCLRRETAGDTDLAPLTGIKIGAREMVHIMAGGALLADHDHAEAYSHSSGGKILVLKKRFRGTVQMLYFSEDLESIRKTEVYGWKGLLYKAEISGEKQTGSGAMPSELVVSDDSGNSLSISVQRFWTGIEPGRGAFSPELPDGAGCGPN
ncbi:MAG: hypothetical protein ACOC0W_04160 [Desulfosalsimonas sp.]